MDGSHCLCHGGGVPARLHPGITLRPRPATCCVDQRPQCFQAVGGDGDIDAASTAQLLRLDVHLDHLRGGRDNGLPAAGKEPEASAQHKHNIRPGAQRKGAPGSQKAAQAQPRAFGHGPPRHAVGDDRRVRQLGEPPELLGRTAKPNAVASEYQRSLGGVKSA